MGHTAVGRMTEGKIEMPSRRKERPLTSYREYLRRYLPDDAANRQAANPVAAEQIGEDRARRAVERAVARLINSE